MDNEDTRRTQAKLDPEDSRREPQDSFLRALLKLQAATDALGAAIRDQDPRGVKAAANDGFSFLLAAIAIFRRLETVVRVRSELHRVGTAWYALRTNHRALTDLFERAKQQLADADLHLGLEQLRIGLALALEGLGEPAPGHET